MKIYKKTETIIKRDGDKMIKISHMETFNDLSPYYKFDEVSMQKMAKRSKKLAEKWDKEEQLESYYDNQITWSDLIHMIHSLFE